MSKLKTLAALAPIAGGIVAIQQLHWLTSHFGTVALIAGAVTVGAAVLVKGKAKDEPVASAPSAEDIVAAWQPPAFREVPAAQRVDPAAVNERLRQLREV